MTRDLVFLHIVLENGKRYRLEVERQILLKTCDYFSLITAGESVTLKNPCANVPDSVFLWVIMFIFCTQLPSKTDCDAQFVKDTAEVLDFLGATTEIYNRFSGWLLQNYQLSSDRGETTPLYFKTLHRETLRYISAQT